MNYFQHYYTIHKTKIITRSKKYYYKHRKFILKYWKIFRQNHKSERKIYDKNFYKSNKKRIRQRIKRYYQRNKKKIAKYQKEYRHHNLVKDIQTHKNYYLKNKIKIIKNNKKYRQLHKNKFRKWFATYMQKRRKTDINFKLKSYLRTRIWRALKGRVKKSNTTINLVGCSINHLKNHIEKKFKKGMSWSNYGKWHVDHIRPCVSFDFRKPEEQRECFNYTNLQPLWAKDNLKKQAQI